MARALLGLEGLTLATASIYFYFVHLHGSWLLFTVLILAPDISMVGYLRDTRLGAVTYNTVHNFILTLVLIAIGVAVGSTLVASLGAILGAHVGLDRCMGYGLKYPTRFRDTHLQRI